VLVASAMCWPAPRATALYSSVGLGAGASRAAVLATPPAPTITGVGIQLFACVVNVSWPAPALGRQYTIRPTHGTPTTPIAGPTTTAGSTVDSILLALLAGNPTYSITATLIGSSWTVTSPIATATGC